MKHKQVLLNLPTWLSKLYTYKKYGRKVPIDEDISGFISNLWKLGIRTLGCCQGTYNPYFKNRRKNKIWILFYSNEDYEKFRNLNPAQKWHRYKSNNQIHLTKLQYNKLQVKIEEEAS